MWRRRSRKGGGGWEREETGYFIENRKEKRKMMTQLSKYVTNEIEVNSQVILSFWSWHT